jgi:hypothetical protein
MIQLKKLKRESIPLALEKALRYRLLNEPAEAESICQDILAVEPHHEQALITLLLALTDQFGTHFTQAFEESNAVLPRLEGEYERSYYQGIINERWADAQLARHMPADIAYNWYRQAMQCFERAESLAQPDDPDPILRWNACARILGRHAHRAPASESMLHDVHQGMDDVLTDL